MDLPNKEGVEPTNNHIERLLRSGVLWRKNAFGCHNEAGCRFVERILTVTQTLRLAKAAGAGLSASIVGGSAQRPASPALLVG